MDTSTFDALTRRFSRQRSRRTALGLMAAGAAALAGEPRNLDARKKKHKKVALCLNGQTITVSKKQRNGYIRQGATAGKCAAGGPTGCTSDAACNACARETCQAGACLCPAGLTRDAEGVCGETLTCKPTGVMVSSLAECCSANGNMIPTNPVTYQCVPGNDRCHSSIDCAGGAKCLGGMCPVKYLATVGQQCAPTVGCPSPASCGSDQFGACACGTEGLCASSQWQIDLNIGHVCDACPAETASCDYSGLSVKCYPACGQRFACCGNPGDVCGAGTCR